MLSVVPALDVVDDTYLAVPPAVVAPVVADPASWAGWWPDLSLEVTEDRGVKGMRWAVTGPLTGSMEIWLEPVGQGTVLHWFLRVDPGSGDGGLGAAGGRHSARSIRRLTRERERRVRTWKAHAFALKDRLEWAERVT